MNLLRFCNPPFPDKTIYTEKTVDSPLNTYYTTLCYFQTDSSRKVKSNPFLIYETYCLKDTLDRRSLVPYISVLI